MARSTSAQMIESLELRTLLSACAPLADDTVAAQVAPLVVSATPHVTAANPFKIVGAGTVLKFKKTKSLPGNGIAGFIHESGTFTDGKGHTGTYALALPPVLSSIQPAELLDIGFKKSGTFLGGSRRYTIQFTPIGKRLSKGLGGKTVTFVTTAAKTAAKGVIAGTLTKIYLKY